MVSQNKSSIWCWHPLYAILRFIVKFSVNLSALLYIIENALSFSEVRSDLTDGKADTAVVVDGVGVVAGEDEAAVVVGVEAEAAVIGKG